MQGVAMAKDDRVEVPPPLRWLVEKLVKAHDQGFFGEFIVTIKEGKAAHLRIVESHQAPAEETPPSKK